MDEKAKDQRDQRLFAQACLRMIEKFGEYLGKSDVELQALALFWTIAERSGELPMMELQDILGMSQSSVSRNVALLSIGSVSNPGPRLIESHEDPEFRRRKTVRLTVRGRKLAEDLRTIYMQFARKMEH